MHAELGTSVVNRRGRANIAPTPAPDRREAVLICAAEPLRSALVELARTRGYEPCESATPLEAIEALLEDGDRIGHALISSDLPDQWGRGLDELLAEEYPHVKRYLLTAS